MSSPLPGRPEQKRARLPYLPGVDGLRAVAVVAVLLYHAQDLSGIPSFLKPQGGFLGVEVFFVISGFLITALLVQEHDGSGTIGLKSFWSRRARRLLPALYVFLGGTIILATLFASDAFDALRRELLGAVFYVSNWLLIATDQSYFEASGRPSLLRHLWSLAIEEQFYLVWPLIVLGCLRWAGPKMLLVLTVSGIVGSTVLLWVLFDQVERFGDVTSVYFRTDARAAALLIGAALGLLWRPWVATEIATSTRWLMDVLGLAALSLVVLMQYIFTDRLIEWASYERLYHGGFLALSVSTVIVIAAVSIPGSRLGWLLGNPLFRWIGTRSYGLYLWHWPIFQLTRPRVDVDLDGYVLFGVRLAVTVVLVELSYQLVEVPVRERRFVSRILEAGRTPRGIAVSSFGALAILLATVGVAVALPTIDRSGSITDVEIASTSAGITTVDDIRVDPVAEDPALPEEAIVVTPEPTITPGPSPEPTATPNAILIAGNFDPAELVRPTPVPTPTQPPLPPPPPLSQPFDIATSQIHIVGDSVIEGAQSQLYRISPRVTVDGRIGRQWWELEGELRAMRAAGFGNDVVVIQLGNNGNFTTQMFDGVMSALTGTRLVLFVNIHAPVLWENEVNGMLARAVNRYAENARLIDWYSASIDHPEYFIEDGTHLQGSGMVAFRYLIENALASLS